MKIRTIVYKSANVRADQYTKFTYSGNIILDTKDLPFNLEEINTSQFLGYLFLKTQKLIFKLRPIRLK